MRFTIPASLALLTASMPLQAQNFLDGGFDLDPSPWTFNCPSYDPLPPDYFCGIGTQERFTITFPFPTPGVRFGYIREGGEPDFAAIEQDVTGFVIGAPYRIEYRHQLLHVSRFPAGNSIRVTVGDFDLGTYTPDFGATNVATQPFIATAETMRIRFRGLGIHLTGHSPATLIDDVRIVTLPEPSLVLILTTLFLLLPRCRRGSLP